MKHKTIIVTGGAGHVASHLIEMLVADECNRVISLDNYFNGSADNHVVGAEYREGHTKAIADLVPETPQIVYHLGEYARISPSFDEPSLVYDMNIVGTFAVLEFCRVRKVAKLVYAASSTKFGCGTTARHASPYSFTKSTNVDLLNAYGAWYGLPYAICYLYNGFGPRERGDSKYATLIAKCERQYVRGEPLTVVAPGSQKRAFTFVKDLARGIVLAGEKGNGDGYTLGAPRSYSVLQIAEAFQAPFKMIEGWPGRDDSTNESSKARDELGWEPTVDVIDYIRGFVRRHSRNITPLGVAVKKYEEQHPPFRSKT